MGDKTDQPAPTYFDSVAINEWVYPSKNTFDVFLEKFSEYPTSCVYHRGQSPFRTKWIAAGIDTGAAVRWSASDHKSSRGENEIADSAVAGFGMFYCVTGKALLSQGGKDLIIKPGCAVIYDLDAPMKIDMSAPGKNDLMNVSFARSEDEKHRNPVQLFSGGLLTEWAGSLASVLAEKDGASLKHLYAAGTALFEAHLEAAQPDDGCLAYSPLASQDLFGRVKQHIQIDAANADLSPTSLAKHFGISVRYVHKLFSMRGLTAQKFIIDTKLHYAAMDLRGVTYPISITAVAFRWGFADTSSFSRAFRARFGCSPREFRNMYRA